MIDEIDRRLQNWAEYRINGNVIGGGVQCALGNIGAGARSTATEIHWPDEVLDTDGAVARIDRDLQVVINLQYLQLNLSPEQRARKARVSHKTFYRRLDTAHQHVLFYLSPPKSAAARAQAAQRVTLRREASMIVKVCQR